MKFGLRKISVEISFLFCIFVCLLVAFDKSGTVLLCFVFILFHELSHILAMCVCGVNIKRIAFEPFGIYIEKSQEPLSAKRSFMILISGCAFNFAACFFFALLFHFFKNKIFLNCALINFSLFIFNALPIKNLDGGEALLLLLGELKLAENPLNTVKIISLICCFCLFALCIILCAKVRFNPSLIIVSLYLSFSLFLSS